MKLYKAFDKNMKCRGFQYEEGETYTHPGTPQLCNEGFHACEVPLDCLKYYSPAEGSIYREVEMEGVTDERRDDSKRVGKVIKIGVKLSIRDLVRFSIYIFKKKTKGSPAATSGDYSTAAVGGEESIALAGGLKSMAKGSIGCWLVLAERDKDGHILGVKAVKVDGDQVKPDTFYILKDGEVVEYEGDI